MTVLNDWRRLRSQPLDRARALVWRGRLREWKADYPGALADFRMAVDLAPEYLPARLHVAYAVLREDPHLARTEVTSLLEHAPDDPDVRFLTARWRRALGEAEEAARLLDDLLPVEPDAVALLVERGRVALDLNRVDDAGGWLNRAAELAPEEREVNFALSDWHRLAGRAEDALRYYEKGRRADGPLESAPRPLPLAGKRAGDS